MRHLIAIVLASVAVSLSACSWGIKLDSSGNKVRAAWDGDVGNCKPMGKVTVSVLDHVGPVDRSDLKVRDELEVMARNEAADLGADTVKPLGDPRDGQQSWNAYHCGNVVGGERVPTRIRQRAADDAADRHADNGSAETYPVQEH